MKEGSEQEISELSRLDSTLSTNSLAADCRPPPGRESGNGNPSRGRALVSWARLDRGRPPKREGTYGAVELDDLGHAGSRLGRTDRRRRRNLGRDEGSEATCSSIHAGSVPGRREGGLGLAGESLCALMRTGWTHSWCTWTGQRGEASTLSSRSLGGRREEGEGNTEPPLSQYTSSCRLTSSVGSLSCKSCCTVTLGYRSERWTASCPARPTTWRLLRDPECETCAFCTQRSRGAIIAPQKTTPWPIRVASGCRRRAAMPSSSLSGSSENGVDALEPPLT